MQSKRRRLAAVLAALAVVVVCAGYADAAPAASRFSYVIHNAGTAYVTKAGLTTVFPGKLNTGDRIFSRDRLMQGSRSIGFDNETCTVTFDNNDLCHAVSIFTGKGDIESTWLWVGRNTSAFGPKHFTGVIDGGTGSFENATGQFGATVEASGALEITASLG
jgi:hypothetical protein